MTHTLHQFEPSGPYLRYCGTLFMPAIYASEQSFMDFFQNHHPRLLGGNVVLRPHSPSDHPPLKTAGPPTQSCLDVWVSCREDNPGVAASIPERMVFKWRTQTEELRRDDLKNPDVPLRRRPTIKA